MSSFSCWLFFFFLARIIMYVNSVACLILHVGWKFPVLHHGVLSFGERAAFVKMVFAFLGTSELRAVGS